MRRLEAGGRARHRAGRGADPEHLRRLAVEVDVDRLHLGRAAALAPEARGRDEEVEQAVAAVAGAVDEHEPAGPRPGQRALGHPRGERGRDARIDGVPALGEDARPGLGGQPDAPGCDLAPSHARSLRQLCSERAGERAPRRAAPDVDPAAQTSRRKAGGSSGSSAATSRGCTA